MANEVKLTREEEAALDRVDAVASPTNCARHEVAKAFKL